MSDDDVVAEPMDYSPIEPDARTQLRILDLEDAVDGAVHMIEFLHGCLTEPAGPDRPSGGYEYAYPDMTVDRLRRLRELVPERPICAHSRMRTEDCDACRDHVARLEHRSRLEERAG